MNKKFYFLLADSNNEDGCIINQAVNEAASRVELTHVKDYEQLSLVLQQGAMPEVILLNSRIPSKQLFDDIAAIRNEDYFKNLPFIFFSSADYKSTIDACHKSGADLYYMISNDFNELVTIVKKLHDTYRENTELQISNGLSE